MDNLKLYNKYYGDSLVVIYHGGRGSGKTLSMTADAVFRMLAGGNVWSNYDINFTLRLPDGRTKHYKSMPVDVDDLIYMQQRDVIRDGVVLLDEWNLWCNSRRSTVNFNLVFNGVTQLIRKRNLTFMFTTQIADTLDRLIREQCDIGIGCRDLHFSYRNLPKGNMISQELTDFSGVAYGRPLAAWNDWEARRRNTVRRLLRHGKDFFDVYPTGFEYDILSVMSKRYTWATDRKRIIADGLDESGEGFATKYSREKLEELVGNLPDGTQMKVGDFMQFFSEEGIEGDLRGHLGRQIKAVGFKRKMMSNGEGLYTLVKGE